jgi:hypothetical protein
LSGKFNDRLSPRWLGGFVFSQNFGDGALNRNIAVNRSRATLSAITVIHSEKPSGNLAGKHSQAPSRMSGQRKFPSNLNVICPVQSCAKKHSA